ncbi:hypothetical protein [Dankookia sp. P2]|uniref:hypothetical protein n=1 Tax=Dankookia sp. P2 TaxID=3423955 RepID=UPI003D665172
MQRIAEGRRRDAEEDQAIGGDLGGDEDRVVLQGRDMRALEGDDDLVGRGQEGGAVEAVGRHFLRQGLAVHVQEAEPGRQVGEVAVIGPAGGIQKRRGVGRRACLRAWNVERRLCAVVLAGRRGFGAMPMIPTSVVRPAIRLLRVRCIPPFRDVAAANIRVLDDYCSRNHHCFYLATMQPWWITSHDAALRNAFLWNSWNFRRCRLYALKTFLACPVRWCGPPRVSPSAQ